MGAFRWYDDDGEAEDGTTLAARPFPPIIASTVGAMITTRAKPAVI